MLADLDDKKITAFRDLVNDNNRFVLKAYANKQGKNQWNLICSSMDWISVAVRNLHSFPALDSNIDIRVMQIYSLISSIDIVNEAVMQLHRVFLVISLNFCRLKEKNSSSTNGSSIKTIVIISKKSEHVLGRIQ